MIESDARAGAVREMGSLRHKFNFLWAPVIRQTVPTDMERRTVVSGSAVSLKLGPCCLDIDARLCSRGVFSGVLNHARFPGRVVSDTCFRRATGADDTSDTEETETTETTETAYSNSSSTSSTGNYTLEEITQYQLNVWTGTFLILLTFLAIYATVTMDVQPDSLLYAKFITDTSGGGLKTD